MRVTTVLMLMMISMMTTAQQKLSLEAIYKNGEYRTQSVPNFRFMNDGQHYSNLTRQGIEKFDIITGESVGILFNAVEAELRNQIQGYSFSKNEDKILMKFESEPVYRHSDRAYYFLYDIERGTFFPVSDKKISNATFSPDGSKVGYTADNNLFWFDCEAQKEHQITTDGKVNEIINGMSDWVYEEELAFTKAFFWSPDGKKIAYYRFDESEVKEMIMDLHNDNLYPEWQRFKYPKVGEKNADVTIKVYDIASQQNITAKHNLTDDFYVARVKWTKDANWFTLSTLNRLQNELTLLKIDAQTGDFSPLLTETSETYVDVHDDLYFLDNGKYFFWTSERDGFNHIYWYGIDGKLQKQLTKGDYDVTRVYGYDKKTEKIIFQAAKKSPLKREVYAVDMKGNVEEIAANEGWNEAQFSKTKDFYVLKNSTANSPLEVRVMNRDQKEVRILETNDRLKSKIKDMPLSKTEFLTIPNAGYDLNALMMKPADFDANKKYPVLMYVYGGPGSQTVQDKWPTRHYWFFQYLTQQGFIIVSVDNRGTGARGADFKKMTYLKLGDLETQDQIAAAKYLGNLDYVDDSKIGIFGWSYGGYMSTLCILKGAKVFNTALAVAPVTNWKWYDTIYTERFMRTEKNNEKGYKENSPVYFADLLEGNYFLAHGMADDNVHFQHSIEMADALIKSNKQFDTYFYPNRNHGMNSLAAQLHLFTKMSNFLNENLK